MGTNGTSATTGATATNTNGSSGLRTATQTKPSQLCVQPAPKPSGWTPVNQQATQGLQATARPSGKRKRPQSAAGGASDGLWTRSSSAGPEASASKNKGTQGKNRGNPSRSSRGYQ
ncbi:hypothetical protein BDW72DRAFT_21528 [Aspergillus terricola var. indicus]